MNEWMALMEATDEQLEQDQAQQLQDTMKSRKSRRREEDQERSNLASPPPPCLHHSDSHIFLLLSLLFREVFFPHVFLFGGAAGSWANDRVSHKAQGSFCENRPRITQWTHVCGTRDVTSSTSRSSQCQRGAIWAAPKGKRDVALGGEKNINKREFNSDSQLLQWPFNSAVFEIQNL